MNLVSQFLSARRDKLLVRLGCWLVCFSLVLGLMMPQQKAEALVAELSMTAVVSLAAAYLSACGLNLIIMGPDPGKPPDKNELVKYVQRLIQEFLDTELGGITVQDWLGSVWDVFAVAGRINFGRHLLDKLMSFAQWVAGKYGTKVGGNVVYNDGDVVFQCDLGNKALFFPFYFIFHISDTVYGRGLSEYRTTGCLEPGIYEARFPSYSTVASLPASESYRVVSIRIYNQSLYREIFTLGDDGYYSGTFEVSQGLIDEGWSWYIGLCPSFSSYPIQIYPGIEFDLCRADFYLQRVDAASLSVNRDEELVYVPPGITAEQGIALDVGAAETMDLDQVLQGVLDDVLAKTLTSTMTAAGEATENPPVEEEVPDVDDLGLPALGAALTSRFPFSIPWDFFRAVQLLAAPAKAPYFEVDFMEPLADEVGGWNGSTTVVLDFSEYAIIGQISRWTSTIGFCLMLAGATKRLIWTA